MTVSRTGTPLWTRQVTAAPRKHPLGIAKISWLSIVLTMRVGSATTRLANCTKNTLAPLWQHLDNVLMAMLTTSVIMFTIITISRDARTFLTMWVKPLCLTLLRLKGNGFELN